MSHQNENEVLEALRRESEKTIIIDGKEWGVVYLGNVGDTKQLAGYLSSLEKKGLYRPYRDGENDGIFGKVLLDKATGN